MLSKLAQRRSRLALDGRDPGGECSAAADARSLWAWAYPRCAGPGCCATRRAAVKGPASRPCRAAIPHGNTARPAVPAESHGGPFPCPGIAGPDSLTLRLSEARLANGLACRSLRCAPLGAAPARSPPRSPATPEAGPLKAKCNEVHAAAAPLHGDWSAAAPLHGDRSAAVPLQASDQRLDRRAIRSPVAPSVARRPQSRRCSRSFGRLRCNRCARRAVTSAATLRRLRGGGSRCASRPTALPPAAPPSTCEGDLWGDLQAVGRETGSLLRLREYQKRTPPIPNPFP